MSLDALLDAALPHVVFDGWSPTSFEAACLDAEISLENAQVLAPRGAVDLAVAYHRRGDQEMLARLEGVELDQLRIRERVLTALKIRLEVMDDKEAVRRATTLFSLPTHATEGGKLIWETADHVWTALGDTSRDGNWYSKRAILSAVWGATVLYWLGDESADSVGTHDFLERRIEDVMRFEKLKGQLKDNPLTKPFMTMQEAVMGKLSAPMPRSDVPGTQN